MPETYGAPLRGMALAPRVSNGAIAMPSLLTVETTRIA